MRDEEQKYGLEGIEQAQGYEPMVPASPVDADAGLTPQDLADTDSDAARHLARPSEADFGELIDRPYLNVKSGERVPENQVVSAEQAAHDLASVRAAEKLEREKQHNSDLNEALDYLQQEQSALAAAAAPPAQEREALSGESPPPPPDDYTPQPDPEHVQATEPQIDPDIAAALQNPKVRGLLEHVNAGVEATKAQYVQATAQLAQEALATMAALVPEIQGMTPDQARGALALMAKQDPQRVAALQQLMARSQNILAAHQQQQVQEQARQRQQQAENLARYEEQEIKRYETLIARDRTPEQIKQLRENVFPVVEKHYGIPQASMRDLYSGAAAVSAVEFMRSSAFQLMLSDAVSYRLSKEAVGRAATRPAPHVQRPGISEPGPRPDEGAIADALRRLNQPGGAEGRTGLRNAAALVAARRGSR